MTRLPRLSGRQSAAALLTLLLAVLLTGAGSARAASFNRRSPLAPKHSVGRPGLPAAPATSEGDASQLQAATGLSPSQVTDENVCAAPSADRAQCAAEAVVLRSNHTRVHPHVKSQRTFTQVFPRGPAGGIKPADASASPATAPAAFTPAFLQQAYDLTYLSQTAGTGDIVGIVDAYDDPTAESDLATFRSTYGLPACTTANGCFQKVNQNGQSSPLPSGNSSWESEISLDVDAVSALCPNCHILLVEANSNLTSDLDAGIMEAQALGANQISNSWTATSSTPFGMGLSSLSGVTLIAATGDHGYAGAGNDNYPAAFPGFTAAGGSTLTASTSAKQSIRGYGESAWTLNGSGWGGGSGCDLYEPKPSWQADTGCTGRSYADVSADADPNTGLKIYDAGNWLLYGGTSLATPLIAAYEAVTGINGATPQWAYTSSVLLNDITTGSVGTCAANVAYICNSGAGYDGPTGTGTISGAVVQGAPGIGGPTYGNGNGNTYTQATTQSGATLNAGVYPNGLDTHYYWQYGTTTTYGQQTASTDIGSGAAPASVTTNLTGLLASTAYHYRLVAQNSAGTHLLVAAL
jgi:subtilase family serine protease